MPRRAITASKQLLPLMAAVHFYRSGWLTH